MTLASEVTTGIKAVESGISAFFSKFTIPPELQDEADKLLSDAGTAVQTAATHEAESFVPAEVAPVVDPLIAEALAAFRATVVADAEKYAATAAEKLAEIDAKVGVTAS